jgi:hypothetical protein
MASGVVTAANVGLAVRVRDKTGNYAARDADAASDGTLVNSIVPFAVCFGVSRATLNSLHGNVCQASQAAVGPRRRATLN